MQFVKFLLLALYKPLLCLEVFTQVLHLVLAALQVLVALVELYLTLFQVVLGLLNLVVSLRNLLLQLCLFVKELLLYFEQLVFLYNLGLFVRFVDDTLEFRFEAETNYYVLADAAYEGSCNCTND